MYFFHSIPVMLFTNIRIFCSICSKMRWSQQMLAKKPQCFDRLLFFVGFFALKFCATSFCRQFSQNHFPKAWKYKRMKDSNEHQRYFWHLDIKHLPFGFAFNPTQVKWNHSIAHCDGANSLVHSMVGNHAEYRVEEKKKESRRISPDLKIIACNHLPERHLSWFCGWSIWRFLAMMNDCRSKAWRYSGTEGPFYMYSIRTLHSQVTFVYPSSFQVEANEYFNGSMLILLDTE